MNNDPLRLAALAAAVAVLAHPAAARSDSAFAASLGTPPAGLATMAQIKTQPQAPAGAKAPLLAASEEALEIMLGTVLDLGKHTAPTPDSKYDNFAYTADANTPTGFNRMGISLFAAPLAGGGINIERLIVDVTTVSFDGDTMTIKNWVFLLDGKGRVHLANHGESAGRREGEMISKPTVNLDLADPAVKARFESILKFWAEY